MGARSSPGAGETIHAAVASPGPGARAAKLCRVRNRPRTVTVLLLSLLAAPVVLVGCADPDAQEAASVTPTPAESSAESSAPTQASAEAGDTGAPAFPANAEPDTGEASPDASVTVSDIRVGRQDGFDRVVFEVGGTGTPGWDVRYVDAAASQGSGKPIDVAGDAVLQVTLTGAGYPYDTGVTEFSADGPVTGAGTETVTEVAFDATFEGTTNAFVGTDSKAPFRVYLLQNPTRVVLDVADGA
jgi:hypothetical protein